MLMSESTKKLLQNELETTKKKLKADEEYFNEYQTRVNHFLRTVEWYKKRIKELEEELGV